MLPRSRKGTNDRTNDDAGLKKEEEEEEGCWDDTESSPGEFCTCDIIYIQTMQEKCSNAVRFDTNGRFPSTMKRVCYMDEGTG
jgi:hypothetical protein